MKEGRTVGIMWKVLDYIKNIVCRDGMTPLPMAITLTIFVNTIFFSMISTVLFSFLPKMVKYFGATELNTGYYAGIIASSLFIGRSLFSMIWGYIADAKSKRFSLILAGFTLTVTTLAFGFSRNFYWATITRFLQGCSMGQLIVFKALVAEICDDTNMALGVSILMTAFSVGNIIGPSIGGFLVFPAEQYPEVFSKENIFGKFGVLLPNSLIVVGICVGIILAIIFLPKDKNKTGENTYLVNSNNKQYNSLVDETIGVKESTFGGYIALSLDYGLDYPTRKEKENHIEIGNDIDSSRFNQGLSLLEKFNKSKFVKVLKIKECFFSCLLYGLFSLADIGFSETFPVLASTSPKYKGMGFSTSQIGTVLLIVSVLVISLQIIVLPKVVNKFGAKKILIASNLTLTFLYPLLPVVAAITNISVLWICLILLIFLIRLFIFAGYLAINILVNNSVEDDLVGSANGAAMTVASTGRLLAPLVCGSLYSWSLTNIKGSDGYQNALGFPFNQFLTFYFLSLWLIMISVFTATLPNRMDIKRIRTEVAEPSNSKHRKPMGN